MIDKRMINRIVFAAAALSACLFVSGCNRSDTTAPEQSGAGTEGGTDAGSAAGQDGQAQSGAEGQQTQTADAGQGGEAAADEVISIDYPFEDRFIYGNKNLYYIEDDGSLTCEYRCKGEEMIAYGAGEDGRYFFLVNENSEYTLYFMNDSRELSLTPIETFGGTYISNVCCYKDKFYYSIFDSDQGADVTYYYDPEGDAFLRDQGMDRLTRFFDNFEGKGLDKAYGNFDIVDDLAASGYIFMQDKDTHAIRIFDEYGDEVTSVDCPDSCYFFKCKEGYLLGTVNEYNDDGRAIAESVVVIDAKNSKRYEILKSDDMLKTPDICDIRDGYLYISRLDYNGGNPYASRNYYRINLSGLSSGDAKEEKVADIGVYAGVSYGFGSYSYANSGTDAFTVKKDRVYYLAFDPEGEVGRRGNMAWRSRSLSDQGMGKEQCTGMMECHEEFADWGTISRREEELTVGDTDPFTYFSGVYESFRFYDDIKNADKLNATLAEIEKGFEETGEETAESARIDIIDNQDPDSNLDWYKEYVGMGYSFEANFQSVADISEKYIQVAYGDYFFYGGAHGMGSSLYHLLDKETGKEVTLKELYSGTEEKFTETAIYYSMEDWKNDEEQRYYSDYSPELEEEMRASFKDCINLEMPVRYDKYGIYLIYSPYAVGPYASGEIEVFVPYYALNMEL